MNYYYIYIYILVDKFSRIYINIIYKSLFVDDANNIFKLFLRKVVRLHGLPKTIVWDRDPKFVSYFWITFWEG